VPVGSVIASAIFPASLPGKRFDSGMTASPVSMCSKISTTYNRTVEAGWFICGPHSELMSAQPKTASKLDLLVQLTSVADRVEILPLPQAQPPDAGDLNRQILAMNLNKAQRTVGNCFELSSFSQGTKEGAFSRLIPSLLRYILRLLSYLLSTTLPAHTHTALRLKPSQARAISVFLVLTRIHHSCPPPPYRANIHAQPRWGAFLPLPSDSACVLRQAHEGSQGEDEERREQLCAHPSHPQLPPQ
jgi:hypothetical protein